EVPFILEQSMGELGCYLGEMVNSSIQKDKVAIFEAWDQWMGEQRSKSIGKHVISPGAPVGITMRNFDEKKFTDLYHYLASYRSRDIENFVSLVHNYAAVSIQHWLIRGIKGFNGDNNGFYGDRWDYLSIIT